MKNQTTTLYMRSASRCINNSTLTHDLNISYQHKSVTKKKLYKNSALGYKESNVIITLYDIL